jgi:(5-formylfuran-3-yl)methyl phosphate synthase
LLDTWGKDRGDLFQHLAEPALHAWIGHARAAGLLVALAGSLSIKGVRAVAGLPADIVGVRAAACLGGRTGVVSEGRVAELKAALAEGGGGQRVALSCRRPARTSGSANPAGA